MADIWHVGERTFEEASEPVPVPDHFAAGRHGNALTVDLLTALPTADEVEQEEAWEADVLAGYLAARAVNHHCYLPGVVFVTRPDSRNLRESPDAPAPERDAT